MTGKAKVKLVLSAYVAGRTLPKCANGDYKIPVGCPQSYFSILLPSE